MDPQSIRPGEYYLAMNPYSEAGEVIVVRVIKESDTVEDH